MDMQLCTHTQYGAVALARELLENGTTSFRAHQESMERKREREREVRKPSTEYDMEQRAKAPPLVPLAMEKRWMWPLLLCSVVVIILAVTSSNMSIISSFQTMFLIFPTVPSANRTGPAFVESQLACAPPPPVGSRIPRLAYLISGSKGDLDRLWRTLRALYHPRNVYVVHLDLESPASERLELALRVANDTVFVTVGNVHVVEKANMVTYRGPTMVASTLHACAILLKESKEWDWFINLSASDYPLVTQDGEPARAPSGQRARPLMVDPGLYRTRKTDVFWVSQKREVPTAFKLFTGSAWVALTREFAEFCVWGWDNLPRILLMYYTNFISSPEGYFQTVICNAPEFSVTVANHDLHYISWDVPPKQHPHTLSMDDLPKMIGSNAPFARKFKRNDPVLDQIDAELLGRAEGSFVPGGWCAGAPLCTEVGDPTRLHPGPGAERLAALMDVIVRSKQFSQNQCR
ncbi:hypothetical protein BHE74_00001163 [Ensete ventricosum]|nr:hypothetical protein BHE74_00001163 [Ensete ventricosum]